MSDEILAATGIGSRKSHSYRAALVATPVHFIANRIARTSVSVIARVSVLRNEIRNHAMEPRILIVSGPGKRQKIPDRDRCIGAEELETNRTTNSIDRRVDGPPGIDRDHNVANESLVPAEWSRRCRY